ncbi:MAG TPA: S8 family serine peptidase [Chitinispirillaceae bacterium]|nr:S8 family serine peptidase [Chitinispirillaceae bacterium]
MCNNTFIVVLLLLINGIYLFSNAQATHNVTDDIRVPPQTENKSVKVWVFFKDRNNGSGSVQLSKKAMLRRRIAHFNIDDNDEPVNKWYIDEIIKMGAEPGQIYKWGNAASFIVKLSELPAISRLSFVKNIRPVGVYSIKKLPDEVLKKKTQASLPVFQHRKMQLDVLNILQAHYYMTKKNIGKLPGEGVLIGFFDSGFRLDHTCFNHLKTSVRIKAQHDFVDGDSDPQDSDSSLNHGSTVLAQVAGYDPGTFTGTAWGVDVALARTEISEREIHTEEDNWVAALVWAESLGVDIVSSSVGYATDFEDSIRIGNEYFSDYPYSSLDGHSTIISHAAALAVKRGMIIVNSIGNEGNTEAGTLNAPADVDGVVAVGAINNRGFLSYFSSVGPTWDGRIKPDCVAPGEGIVAPEFTSANAYVTNFTGTSYSTPLVSGILALIIQSSKEKLATAEVLNRLLKYCHFSPGQDSIDNRYGHGIPDALFSIMDSNDLLIFVTDSSAAAVAGAEVRTINGHLAGVTDQSGMLLLNNVPANTSLTVLSSLDSARVAVEKLPYYEHIVLNTVSSLNVKVEDKEGVPVSGCTVVITIPGESKSWNLQTTQIGDLRFVYGMAGDIEIAVTEKGYFPTAVLRMKLAGNNDSVKIVLTKIPENSLILFPTLVKKNDEQVTLLFTGALEFVGTDVIASIYSVSGKQVWSECKKSQVNEPVLFKWQFRGGRGIIPGTYYAIVRYNKKMYRKKLLIAG